MTSSSPLEAPHIRGHTVVPESPVPIHVPNSAKIPVLQNQIDPIFNLTSTHLQPLLTVANPGMAALHKPAGMLSVVRPDAGLATNDGSDNNFISFEANQELDAEGDDDSAISYEDEEAAEQDQETQVNITSQNVSPPTANTSTSAAAHESLSPPHTNETSALLATLNQKPLEEANKDTTGPPELSQDAPLTNGHVSDEPDSISNGGDPAQSLDQPSKGGDVNYEILLESLSPSTSAAPSAESIASLSTAVPAEPSFAPRPSSSEQPLSALPLPAGLPPRPPPQEKPAIHPNYNAENDISTFHFPQTQNSNAQSSHSSQPNNSFVPTQGLPHSVTTPKAAVGANGLPPPPLATFQQPSPQAGQAQPSPVTPQSRQADGKDERLPGQIVPENEDEVPWTPELEQLWTEFQREEAVYVSEGLWDRFPQGSRLFVGNLFTEKVTKRDLFFIFHRYGRLAQISIKNAYGFIQYLDAANCQRALQLEQGMPARGRKMHLEISKPQKNTRNAAASAAGDSLRAGNRRRSRSPDYTRGSQRAAQRNGADRYGPNGNTRVEMRRRDDYRPARSPSPRGFRGRDDYYGPRGRSPDRYYGGRRSRSRSPYGRSGRYRSRSPQGPDLDDEANLPIPRRSLRDVPDVQIILIDQVDRTFVGYIEKSFRDRGLRCDVLQLPRVSLIAVVKRQIIEGVQAVVKVFRQSQITGKIPLQVFDRRAGADNVRFEEYEELDANVAAELVVRAKSTHIAPQPGQQYQPPPYTAAQYGQQPPQMPPQQPQPAGTPNLANLITSLDGPALQKLLGAMSQSPQTPQTPQHPQPQSQHQPDLAALLGGVNRQQPPQQGYPYGTPQQQPPQQQQQQQYSTQTLNSAFANNPALASLLANAANRGPQLHIPQQHYHQPGQQPQVQNIMEQLSRWKQ